MFRSPDCQSVMNRIMLRFRPIAPKPVDGGVLASGAAEPETGKGGSRRRPKRKYVRVRGRQDKTKGADGKPPAAAEKAAVTLQLLPERCEERSNVSDPHDVDDGVATAESSVEGAAGDGCEGGRSVVETSIIVERVTERFAGDKVGLGFSDEEKMCSLEKDTCPGFVSDWTNNVIWVNEAYKNMVAAAEDGGATGEKGFLVCLVVKDELPHLYPSFACRARVMQRRGQGQNWNKVVPCDVWRMEFARLAWKLDVNTALSLSL